MPPNGTPLTPIQVQQVKDEYAQLVASGLVPSAAKKQLMKRWNRSSSTMRAFTSDLDIPLPNMQPLDAVGVARSAGMGKVSIAHSFIPPELDYVPHSDIVFKDDYTPPRLSGARTYILTGWEIRVKADYGFIDCLRQIAKRYDADMYLCPHYLPDLDFLPNELRSNFKLLTEDLHFNENCFFKYVETHALNVSPLMGWKGFSDKTAIIPGLIKELDTLPTDKDCKQLITTGSIGHFTLDSEHYRFITESSDQAYKKRFEGRWNSSRSQKKLIAIACEYVMPSALIVHVLDDKRFLTRRVTMQPGSDSVYDLNLKYTAGQKKPSTVRPTFLSVGDTHAWFADASAVTASLEQIRALNPRDVILNDFTDAISANHHEKDRAFTFHQAPPIQTEIEYTMWMLRGIVERAKGCRVVYRHSNHDDFFEKFLDAGEKYWRMNYNYSTAIELQQLRKSTGKHPVQLLLDLDKLGVAFSPDSNALMYDRISVIHGHETVSGRRAVFKELVRHYNYVCMGHGHSPKEWRNGVMGGLTARRDMPYTDGSLQGSLHANVLGHPDGSLQLLPIIKGVWTV